MTEEEGMNFVSAFRDKFGTREHAEERLEAERRASMTPKQRARRGPPKIQINFRATERTKGLIDELAKRLELSATDVLALAVETLAEQKLKGKRGS